MNYKPYKVEGKSPIKLQNLDSTADPGLTREEGEKKHVQAVKELIELQELLYAARQKSVLIVLQGRDTSGKDGAIRHVTGPLNSQSCEVASFKIPTEEELAHDFLWRIHSQTPLAGHIKIFNRSHYEDVLVVRVHKLVSEKTWRARYEHINNFERLLVDSGVIVLKFYLHISKEEQEERLRAREKDPTKFWKLSVNDWKEREFWDDYTAAYEEAINLCSSKQAPWIIVPADKKWFRNMVISQVLRDALLPYKDSWLKELKKMGTEQLKVIKAYRKSHH